MPLKTKAFNPCSPSWLLHSPCYIKRIQLHIKGYRRKQYTGVMTERQPQHHVLEDQGEWLVCCGGWVGSENTLTAGKSCSALTSYVILVYQNTKSWSAAYCGGNRVYVVHPHSTETQTFTHTLTVDFVSQGEELHLLRAGAELKQ